MPKENPKPKPQVCEIDENGETTYRDMTDEELAQRQKDTDENTVRKAEEDEAEAQRQADIAIVQEAAANDPQFAALARLLGEKLMTDELIKKKLMTDEPRLQRAVEERAEFGREAFDATVLRSARMV